MKSKFKCIGSMQKTGKEKASIQCLALIPKLRDLIIIQKLLDILNLKFSNPFYIIGPEKVKQDGCV